MNYNNTEKIIVFLDLFIPFLLVYMIYIWVQKRTGDVSLVRSRLDNKEYLVRNLKDRQLAADMLSNLSRKLQGFVEYLQQRHPKHEGVERLVKRFDPRQVSEGDYDSRYTTYTLNKGEKIVFCLRSRDGSERIHRENLLMFVSVHELAHIMTKSHGHTDEFKDNFKFLLEQAVDAGIYKPEDFRANPETYCGIQVSNTPLSDEHFGRR